MKCENCGGNLEFYYQNGDYDWDEELFLYTELVTNTKFCSFCGTKLNDEVILDEH